MSKCDRANLTGWPVKRIIDGGYTHPNSSFTDGGEHE